MFDRYCLIILDISDLDFTCCAQTYNLGRPLFHGTNRNISSDNHVGTLCFFNASRTVPSLWVDFIQFAHITAFSMPKHNIKNKNRYQKQHFIILLEDLCDFIT